MRLPRLGFGGAPVGNLYEALSPAEAGAAVDAAWESGIRFFDTAPHYGLGLSERRIGSALVSRPRDAAFVSTKVGRLLDPAQVTSGKVDPEGFAVPATWIRRRDYSRDGILRSVEHSLIRTGLDRFDMLFLHDPDSFWDAASTTGINTLVELREEKVIGAVGVGMNQSAMLARFIRETDVDVVMLAGRYTLVDRAAETELLPTALQHGVAVIAAGVYNSGLLSRATVPDDAMFDYAVAAPNVIQRARAIAEVCKRHGVELPAAAIAFPQRHPAVRSVVVGVRTAAQAVETVARAQTPIPEDLWIELGEVRFSR